MRKWSKRDGFQPPGPSSRPRQDDPLSRALEPPPGETEDQRRQRILEQEEAQRVSMRIDESIQASKKDHEKWKKAIKVLLLGQAESGKSATLKNFQLVSSPDHFWSERAAWKTVIQLNLISSIKKVLEVLKAEWEADMPPVASSPVLRPRTLSSNTCHLTDDHRRIHMRLSPLVSLESGLNRNLFPAAAYNTDNSNEVCVRAGSSWKSILSTASNTRPSSSRRRPGSADSRIDDLSNVLAACRGDIVALWNDPIVKAVLAKHHVRLQETPGFFLDDATRIATVDYVPSDSDIVRARVRTVGVEEHKFFLNDGVNPVAEWYIYDVGGSRSIRPQWIPFFDDVNAIIFLAPLAFNQVLDEDRKVNRLEDSIHLWREVCANRLLAKATIILFLNKMDILRQNLAAGIQVVKYVPSYGGAPNDVQHVTSYFLEKFRSYHRRLSPVKRPFICYETSAIDTHATSVMLLGVREGILRAHLQKSNVL